MRVHVGPECDLEKFALALMSSAKETLQERGQVFGMCVLAPAQASKPLVFAALSTAPREFWPALIKALVERAGGKRFIATVSEAWYKELPMSERHTARAPSTYDDREEILMIEAKDTTGLTIAHIQPIDRDERGRAVFTRAAYFLGTGEDPYISRMLEFA